MPILGTGPLGSKIWSGAAITVIGIDVPSVDGAVTPPCSRRRARVLNVRVHPEQDAAEAQAAVIRHLEARAPFGVPLQVTGGDTGDGFAATRRGPAWDAMVAARERRRGAPTRR